MLEHYFKKPATIDRIRSSWLGQPIERYAEWLGEQGYATRCVYHRVPLLMGFGQFAWSRGARSIEDLPAHLRSFVTQQPARPGKRFESEQGRQALIKENAGPIRQFLSLILPDYARKNDRTRRLPFADTVPGFFDYLRQERGLRPTTITGYRFPLWRLENYLKRNGALTLGDLSPAIIFKFIVNCKDTPDLSRSNRPLSRGAIYVLCSCLRIFLQYLWRQQMTRQNLGELVECPRQYRLAETPRCISAEDMTRLLSGIDRRDALGRRDYAILLLMATYGLRAREVAALTLDDLDWQRERLRVPERKAGHSTLYPLTVAAGEAIIAYLHSGRPQTADRHLFFSLLAPIKPMTWQSVSCQASAYLHRAGIEVARPGSHTFRHSCVQRLVDAQIPWKTIGDFVGHRSEDSTRVYTKVAIEALREVAMGEGEAIL